MNRKKIVAIVAVLALVAILAVCLVACNADSYTKKLEKADYKVAKADQDDLAELGLDESKIEWAVVGSKSITESVTVIKFKKTADAKDFESDFGDSAMSLLLKCERSSAIVFVGTEAGIKAAK